MLKEEEEVAAKVFYKKKKKIPTSFSVPSGGRNHSQPIVSSRDAMELCEGEESHAGSNTHYNHGFLIPQVHGQGGESE